MINVEKLEYLFFQGQLSNILIGCSSNDLRYLEFVVLKSHLDKSSKNNILGMIITCSENIAEKSTKEIVL